MSDQQEQQIPTAAPTPGEWLRQERERQGRTVQQLAADLHIGVYMVEAIESNRFAVLGAEVFARGHLRKYANLLGLSMERVQELYQGLSNRPRDQDPVPAMHRETEPSIPMSPDSKERRTLRRPAKWTFAIAVGLLILAGLAAWVIHTRSKPVLQEQVAPVIDAVPDGVASTDAAPMAVASSAAVVPSAAGAPTTPIKPAAITDHARVVPQAMPLNGPAATRGKVRLKFSFSQESWVEVYDARGTRMLYDVGLSGQTRGVDVDPPAQIVLGQAAAVTTEVNGRQITVPAHHIANQVARFTIGADGAAQ